MAINELRSISIFVTAAELGSLRKTAAALNISPQAASQALAQLEQHLDVRLFHRTTRSMALTDEGRRFLPAGRFADGHSFGSPHGYAFGRDPLCADLADSAVVPPGDDGAAGAVGYDLRNMSATACGADGYAIGGPGGRTISTDPLNIDE